VQHAFALDYGVRVHPGGSIAIPRQRIVIVERGTGAQQAAVPPGRAMTHGGRVDTNDCRARAETGIDRRQTAAAKSNYAHIGVHLADELRIDGAAGGVPE
jgi:hypothetical protein